MGQPPTWAELQALHAADLAANERGAAHGGSGAEHEVREAAEALADIRRTSDGASPAAKAERIG